MAKARRTTHRSAAGTKLYAVRGRTGKFKDIQTYKRAQGADIKRKSQAETAAGAKKKGGAKKSGAKKAGGKKAGGKKGAAKAVKRVVKKTARKTVRKTARKSGAKKR